MSQNFIVSRRTAALAVASTLVAAAGPAASGTLPYSAFREHPIDTHRFDGDHQQIATLLKRVRLARGERARSDAFQRCKKALRAHDASEAIVAVSSSTADVASSMLYRGADPTTVLTNVVVRELDAWPKADAGWLARFSDLESVFAMHVAEQGRADHA